MLPKNKFGIAATQGPSYGYVLVSAPGALQTNDGRWETMQNIQVALSRWPSGNRAYTIFFSKEKGFVVSTLSSRKRGSLQP